MYTNQKIRTRRMHSRIILYVYVSISISIYLYLYLSLYIYIYISISIYIHIYIDDSSFAKNHAPRRAFSPAVKTEKRKKVSAGG